MINSKIANPIFNSIQRSTIRAQMDQKAINHEFFLLVREHKYDEALQLGLLFLKYHPQNAAITKFCDFIQHNKDQLCRIIDDQQDLSEQQESDDSEDEDSDTQQQQQQQSQKQIFKRLRTQSNSIKAALSQVKHENLKISKPATTFVKNASIFKKPVEITNLKYEKTYDAQSVPSAKHITSLPRISKGYQSKQNIQICKGHKWSHNCKNANCPNRFK